VTRAGEPTGQRHKLGHVSPGDLPELDESFPRRYDAHAQGLLQTPDEFVYFPARPVLTVAVAPKRGQRWTGVFGEDYPGGFTGVYTTPDDRSLCVVCSGYGYFVEATDPSAWLRVECVPVRFVIPCPNHGLIVFGDFTEFVGYRFDDALIGIRLEVAWRTARLGWDDLEVTRVTDDRIEGRAWHAPDDRMVGFSVDLATGAHEGGAYPPPDSS
jgi:hypothetical protein